MEVIFSPDYYIFLLSILLIIGIAAGKFSDRIGVPSLVLFTGVGMLLGSDFLNLIYLDDPKIVQLFGTLALIIILFEGGFNTKLEDIKPIMKSAGILASLGVVLTTAVIGLLTSLILRISLIEGLMLGAIVGSTDAAAVFGVLGNKKIKPRVKATLEAESGLNDPMAIFLTLTLIAIATTGRFSPLNLGLNLLWQAGFGIGMGFLMGKVSTILINKIHLISGGLYPIFAFALAIFTYSTTAQLNGSGFLAVYIYALILGNTDLAYRSSIAKFHEGFALMMQILMFIMLGLLVFPRQLPGIALSGMLLSIGLIFIARPISVLICTSLSSYSIKEKIFMAWTGLRGAIPIILATYLLVADIANSDTFFNIIFFVVLTSALVQGLTITPLATKLGLTVPQSRGNPFSLELTALGKTNVDIIELDIDDNCPAIGKRIMDLPLPKNTLINVIIRNNQVITPKGKTLIEAGDILFVLCNDEAIPEVKDVFYPQPAMETEKEETEPKPEPESDHPKTD